MVILMSVVFDGQESCGIVYVQCGRPIFIYFANADFQLNTEF